jgi:hypothetical protein
MWWCKGDKYALWTSDVPLCLNPTPWRPSGCGVKELDRSWRWVASSKLHLALPRFVLDRRLGGKVRPGLTVTVLTSSQSLAAQGYRNVSNLCLRNIYITWCIVGVKFTKNGAFLEYIFYLRCLNEKVCVGGTLNLMNHEKFTQNLIWGTRCEGWERDIET